MEEQIIKNIYPFIGAIIGDVTGSIYEFNNIHTKDLKFFAEGMHLTDDSILTLAVMDSLLECMPIEHSSKWEEKYKNHLIDNFKKAVRDPASINAGYGGGFYRWAISKDRRPYKSYGNGSAMRVSPVAYVAEDIEECKWLAKLTSEVTHNHPEGIKGGEATALAVYMAYHGASKKDIFKEMVKYYPSIGKMKYEDLRLNNTFSATCQKTVGESIYLFLQSESFKDCIKSCISIGGDSDTIAAIGGSIASAYYGDMLGWYNMLEPLLSETQKTTIKEFQKCFEHIQSVKEYLN